jgi:hypothetical protein
MVRAKAARRRPSPRKLSMFRPVSVAYSAPKVTFNRGSALHKPLALAPSLCKPPNASMLIIWFGSCNGAYSTCPFFELLAAPSAKPRPPFSIPQTPISPAHRRSSNFGTIDSVIVVLVGCNVSCAVVLYRTNMGIDLFPPAFLLNLTKLENVKPLSAHLASMANSSAIPRGPKPFTRFQIKKWHFNVATYSPVTMYRWTNMSPRFEAACLTPRGANLGSIGTLEAHYLLIMHPVLSKSTIRLVWQPQIPFDPKEDLSKKPGSATSQSRDIMVTMACLKLRNS